MPRSLEARVERLAGPLQRRGLAAAHHRVALRARLEVCEFVRAAVREAGLDPAALSALRREAEAQAALTALGDTPALRAADEVLFASEEDPGDADEALGELVRLARLYVDGRHPAATDSLAAWHAWALLSASSPSMGEGRGGGDFGECRSDRLARSPPPNPPPSRGRAKCGGLGA